MRWVSMTNLLLLSQMMGSPCRWWLLGSPFRSSSGTRLRTRSRSVLPDDMVSPCALISWLRMSIASVKYVLMSLRPPPLPCHRVCWLAFEYDVVDLDPSKEHHLQHRPRFSWIFMLIYCSKSVVSCRHGVRPHCVLCFAASLYLDFVCNVPIMIVGNTFGLHCDLLIY